MSSIENSDFVGPHELHLTVNPDTTDESLFTRVCNNLGIKAHVILNEYPGPNGGKTEVDYLTGSEIVGRSSEAFSELGRIAASLRAEGLDVVREKIETTPWHPLAPKTSLDQLHPGTYFECHFTLPDLDTIHNFRILKWGEVPFLISTTENKRKAGKLFATMRHYIATSAAFCQDVSDIHKALEAQLGYVKEPTVEFALYDSNPNHDKLWVDSYRNQ